MVEHKNISPDTITRTILLGLALINQFLTLKGLSPIPVNDPIIEQYISFSFLGITALWSWWKNNSVTQAALHGDEAMQRYKNT